MAGQQLCGKGPSSHRGQRAQHEPGVCPGCREGILGSRTRTGVFLSDKIGCLELSMEVDYRGF